MKLNPLVEAQLIVVSVAKSNIYIYFRSSKLAENDQFLFNFFRFLS